MPTDSRRAWHFAALYLLNLLLLPGLAFALFAISSIRHPPANHGERFYARFVWVYSLLAGLLLLAVPLVAGLMWYQSDYFWVVMLTFWVSCHGLLVLAGVVALAGALSDTVVYWLLPSFLQP